MAKLYNKGKLEPHAVESVYLGHDSHCNADIVRPYIVTADWLQEWKDMLW